MENLKLKDEEIIELLKKGFKAELIGFEFDITINKINELKKLLDNKNKVNSENKIPIKNVPSIQNETDKKQETNKPNNVIKNDNNKDKSNVKSKNPLNSRKIDNKSQENETKPININTVKIDIKSIKEEITNSTAKAKILKQLYRDLEESTLTIEEFIELIEILSNVSLKDVQHNQRQAYVNVIPKVKDRIKIKLSSQIAMQSINSNNLEELKNLSEKIDLINKNTMGIKIDKHQISRKIEKLQQEEAIKEANKIKSPEIEKIVKQLAGGTLNIDEAINVINEEARKQIESKPKIKFGSLTLEQEKSKICIQINNALKKQSEKYPISNPTLAIKYLEQLSGNKENSITTVVKNLIERQEFKKAQEICNTIPATSEHTESPFKRMLENEIKKAKSGINQAKQKEMNR